MRAAVSNSTFTVFTNLVLRCWLTDRSHQVLYEAGRLSHTLENILQRSVPITLLQISVSAPHTNTIVGPVALCVNSDKPNPYLNVMSGDFDFSKNQKHNRVNMTVIQTSCQTSIASNWIFLQAGVKLSLRFDCYSALLRTFKFLRCVNTIRICL